MTRRFVPLALAAAAFLGGCADAPTTSAPDAPLLTASARDQVIPGRYIVLFHDRVADPARAAAQLAAAHGGEVHATYQFAVKGFAATLPAAAVEALRRNPNVASIEPDQVAQPTAVQTPVRWALDRIDERALALNDTFIYNYNGTGVQVYVIDSGIDVTHPEFGGRATLGYDACFRGCYAGDGYGHGTKVAGQVGSASYGVAKNVSLISVRVYASTPDANGIIATESTIMQGVDWVTQQKQLNLSQPMIANISSSLPPSPSLDAAIRSSIAAGVTYVVGAGNSAANACNYSPARVAEALTVGGTRKDDYMWSGSNYGPCVDLFAPAYDIRTTAVGGGSVSTSGTSLSSPLVAGFAAQYLQAYPASSPGSVHSAVIYYTTKNVLVNLGAGSYNRLLFTNWVQGQSGRPPGCCL